MSSPFQSRRVRLIDEIRERILDGRYPGGMRLIEMKLAEEFGMSQSPVREALRELVALRYAESLPYKGTRVRQLTPKEVADAFSVRGLLEEHACQLAIQIGADIRNVAKAHAFATRAAQRRDIPGTMRHDDEFHRSIVEASGNAALLRSWESLQAEARVQRAVRADEDLAQLVECHGHIVTFLQQGDGVSAGAALREHLEQVSSAMAAEPT